MVDLISIGGISIDLYFEGESLTLHDHRFQLVAGGKYHADYLYESVGGGGANVAIGAYKNGLKSAVCGIIGNNSFKKVILEELDKNHVSSTLCRFEDNYLNISAILLSHTGEQSIIHFVPPHHHIINGSEDRNKFLNTKAVYFGNLPDVSLTEREGILHFLKKNKIITAVNLGAKDCERPLSQLKEYIEGVNILILNAHEFAMILKKSYEQINFKENLVNKYDFLKETIVIITDGKNGSYGYTGDRIFFEDAKNRIMIKDATGGGDGYTSAFLAHYLKTENIQESMLKGTAYAEKILSQVGAN